MKDEYKSLQGTIKLWCFTKWENCDIICAEKSSIDIADVIAEVEDNKIGFIFTTDKSTDFIKQQIINCRKICDNVYLITNSIKSKDLLKLDNDVCLLNIADKYGFGNIIEEKIEPQ